MTPEKTSIQELREWLELARCEECPFDDCGVSADEPGVCTCGVGRARQLAEEVERELTAQAEEIERLKQEVEINVDVSLAMAKDLERTEAAHEDVSRTYMELVRCITPDYPGLASLDDAKAEIARLREDRDRLDWLIENHDLSGRAELAAFELQFHRDYRAAIDAAMAEEGGG